MWTRAHENIQIALASNLTMTYLTLKFWEKIIIIIEKTFPELSNWMSTLVNAAVKWGIKHKDEHQMKLLKDRSKKNYENKIWILNFPKISSWK